MNLGKHYIEVIVPSDNFQSAGVCGDFELLYPPFKARIENLIEEYHKYNPDEDIPYVLESFRSHALQNAYYYRGASKIRGGNILNAGMHHLGIAVDLVNLKDKNGNGFKDPGEVVDWKNLDYVLLRRIANGIGITTLAWEQCHFQHIQTSEQNEARQEVYNYVKQWQYNSNLKPDGIVGPKTIAKAKQLYL